MAKLSDDDILELLRSDMDRAKAFQRELSEEREEHYKWYRAEPYGNERPGWSQIVHPTIFSVVEWMKPGLMEVFTGDFFSFTPPSIPGQDKEQAKARADKIKKYIRHKLFKELDGEQVLDDVIHATLTGHYGVLKVCHKDEWDIESKKVPLITPQDYEALNADPAFQKLIGGEPVDIADPMSGVTVPCLKDATLVRKVSKYSGFSWEVVPAWELYMLPGFDNLADNPFVAHVVRRDLDYIKRQEMAGIYRKGSADKVEDRLGDSETRLDSTGEIAELYGVDEQSNPQDLTDYDEDSGKRGANQVWVWECYTRMALDGTGLLKPCIVTVCNGVVLREPVENPYGGPPFELFYVYKEPHKINGWPIAKQLNQWQRSLTNQMRMIQDAAARSTYGNVVTTDPRARKILTGMGPGDVGLVPALNVFQPLDGTPPSAPAFNAIQMTLAEVAKESGVNENMQGLDNNSLNKTASGMSMRLSAGMQRQKLYARRMARAFKRAIQRTLDIIRMYPPSDDIQVVGEDIALTADDLRGQYSVDIEVGVGPQDKLAQAQAMDATIGFMAQVGVPMGICGPQHLIAAMKAKGEYLDVDMSEYFYEPEKVDENNALKGQLQQSQQQLQGMQQAIDDHSQEMQQQDAALAEENVQLKAALEDKTREYQLKERELVLKEQEVMANLALKEKELAANLQLKAVSEAAKARNNAAKCECRDDEDGMEDRQEMSAA